MAERNVLQKDTLRSSYQFLNKFIEFWSKNAIYPNKKFFANIFSLIT